MTTSLAFRRVRIPASLLIAASLVLSSCGGGGSTPAPPPSFDTSAVAAADPGSAVPATWQTGTFIEIYVRGYQDSDGDGIGDLKGLSSRLDYLKDLGVTGIWLMPVTRSQDHDHGYAVTDYRDVETQYGSLADFDDLVAQAHARGIGVIIDYVMNHSAAQHPAFLNSKSSAGNAYRDWYVWQASKPLGWSIYGSDPWHSGTDGYYFAGFWDQMPEFNLLKASVVAYHHDSMRFWLNRGVDGFRFDAVGNLVEHGPSAWEDQPENYTLMGGVRQLLNGYAQRYMVCEGPADPAGFAAALACGSAFAFGHQYDIVNAAKGTTAAIQSVADYFKTASPSMATMVSNHDAFAGDRLYAQVGGNVVQYKLAAATYLLQPGIPFIYYGEEVGMSNNSSLGGDWKLRTPMSWTSTNAGAAGFSTGSPFRSLASNVASYNVSTEATDANSILSFYKAMLALRNTLPSIARGAYESPVVTGSTMSFRRVLGPERTLVVINYGTSATTASISALPANAAFSAAFPSGGANVTANAAGTAVVPVAAQSVLVYKQF